MVAFRLIPAIFFLFVFEQSYAQQLNRTYSGNQCSAIREVIYSAYEKQFDNLLYKEIKGSHGYQVQGTWRFETDQYGSLLEWPGASKTYIDNSKESTDSSLKLTSQFVAEFGPYRTMEEAKQKFEYLNNQIAECRLPLSDTNITLLRPLPLDKIKDELPVAAIDAKLYPVRVKDATAAEAGQEVVIMTAYERNGQLFTAYMIVEYRLRQNEIGKLNNPDMELQGALNQINIRYTINTKAFKRMDENVGSGQLYRLT